jgi:hypothetical protein
VNHVRGTYRRIQRPNRPLRVRHMPPRFSPPLWNVHDATIQGDARTNNQYELVKQQVFSFSGSHSIFCSSSLLVLRI